MAAALAAARFRLDPTLERALTAQTAAAAAPWPWLTALVSCWRGEFLRDAGAAEDARRQFEAIGAQFGIRRAQAVLRRLGARLPRQDHGAGVLSPREIEVADLVAEGLSNPAIARRLYLSRPNVASHVSTHPDQARLLFQGADRRVGRTAPRLRPLIGPGPRPPTSSI